MLLRSQIVRRYAARTARRRLRRAGGTQTVAWAVRLPLVTLALASVLAGSHRR
ncbi:MAG: hypothetical protein AB7V42_13030 [Thermoleophilia bacterium]